MTLKTMTIDDLCVSPFNVRQNKIDAHSVEGMAESLLKCGQLYPLVVHPMPAGKPKAKPLWGALVGGWRLRALGRSFIEMAETNGQTTQKIAQWARLEALLETYKAALGVE